MSVLVLYEDLGIGFLENVCQGRNKLQRKYAFHFSCLPPLSFSLPLPAFDETRNNQRNNLRETENRGEDGLNHSIMANRSIMAGDLARSSVLIVLMKLISPLDGGMWLAVVEFSAVRDRYSRFSPRYSLIPPPLVFDYRLLFTPNLFKNLILTRKSS